MTATDPGVALITGAASGISAATARRLRAPDFFTRAGGFP